MCTEFLYVLYRGSHASSACVGQAFSGLQNQRMYPVVGLRSVGEVVKANFGQTNFQFDIYSYIQVQNHCCCYMSIGSFARFGAHFVSLAYSQELLFAVGGEGQHYCDSAVATGKSMAGCSWSGGNGIRQVCAVEYHLICYHPFESVQP